MWTTLLYLSGPSFVDYVDVRSSSSDEMVSKYKSFALLGGRGITNGEQEDATDIPIS